MAESSEDATASPAEGESAVKADPTPETISAEALKLEGNALLAGEPGAVSRRGHRPPVAVGGTAPAACAVGCGRVARHEDRGCERGLSAGIEPQGRLFWFVSFSLSRLALSRRLLVFSPHRAVATCFLKMLPASELDHDHSRGACVPPVVPDTAHDRSCLFFRRGLLRICRRHVGASLCMWSRMSTCIIINRVCARTMAHTYIRTHVRIFCLQTQQSAVIGRRAPFSGVLRRERRRRSTHRRTESSCVLFCFGERGRCVRRGSWCG